MKKKIIAIILVILIYIVLASCNACTSTNAQSKNAEILSSSIELNKEDTVKNKFLSNKDSVNVVFSFPDSQDRNTKAMFRKEIRPMKIDTLKKFKRDSMYKKLEENERRLNMQYKTVDSIIVARKK